MLYPTNVLQQLPRSCFASRSSLFSFLRKFRGEDRRQTEHSLKRTATNWGAKLFVVPSVSVAVVCKELVVDEWWLYHGGNQRPRRNKSLRFTCQQFKSQRVAQNKSKQFARMSSAAVYKPNRNAVHNSDGLFFRLIQTRRSQYFQPVRTSSITFRCSRSENSS